MILAYKLPLGYVATRHQVETLWFNAVIQLAGYPRALFTVSEAENIFTLGSIHPTEADPVYAFLEKYVYTKGDVVVKDRVEETIRVLATLGCSPSLSIRLLTKVNKGKMEGASLGVNGIDQIAKYLTNHELSANAYLTISYVQQRN